MNTPRYLCKKGGNSMKKLKIYKEDERNIGFIQGVAFAASVAQQYHIDGIGIINESNIPIEDFIKYADKYDLEILGLLKEKSN